MSPCTVLHRPARRALAARVAVTVVVLIGVGLTIVGCSSGTTDATPDPVDDSRTILTVNGPLACMARAIVGDGADVEYPGPADGDPSEWRPSVETLGAFQQADLILLNGAGYAGWTASASLPGSRMVDTSDGFAGRLIHESAVTHTHGTEGHHHHADRTAFTTWLDLELAAEHALAIHDAVVARWPDLREAAGVSHQTLRTALLDLHDEYRTTLSAVESPILTSHPVYQYFGRAYGLEIHSVHWEPVTVPDEHGWEDLYAILRDHDASLMLWEGPPHPDIERTLLEGGVTCVVVDPAATSDDLLGVLRSNLERIRAALN